MHSEAAGDEIGGLVGVRPDGVTSFELTQQASDGGGSSLVYFAFDLIELDGENIALAPSRAQDAPRGSSQEPARGDRR